jgi:hypothetical protein
MTNRTPTPWAVDPDDRPGMEYNIHIVESARPHHRVCFMASDGPNAENAAFIVRACNSHETLVKALREIVKAYENPDDVEPEESMIELARDAIRGLQP